ncbi:hypothetical protein AB834_00310 [PVC group bacterium (ex Bugula neritina AB1)]|nr:hypothetical protein AB834_00310 [PVC group bacterium (ex Bugula neritina AB1)]
MVFLVSEFFFLTLIISLTIYFVNMKNNKQKTKIFRSNLKYNPCSSYQHSSKITVKIFRTIFLVSNRSQVISKESAEALFKKVSYTFHSFGHTSQLLTSTIPVCRKAIGLRIGKGKGEPKFFALKVKLGQPIFIIRLHNSISPNVLTKINLYINRLYSLNIQ